MKTNPKCKGLRLTVFDECKVLPMEVTIVAAPEMLVVESLLVDAKFSVDVLCPERARFAFNLFLFPTTLRDALARSDFRLSLSTAAVVESFFSSLFSMLKVSPFSVVIVVVSPFFNRLGFFLSVLECDGQ